MKLDKNIEKAMDLKEDQPEEEFEKEIESLLRYGVPAKDRSGHWVELRIRVRPLQLDMIGAIKERMPEGWFKTQSSLCRSLIAVGCKASFKHLQAEKNEWNEILSGLNQIAREERLAEFKQEMKILKNRVVMGDMESSKKMKAVDIAEHLEKLVVDMW